MERIDVVEVAVGKPDLRQDEGGREQGGGRDPAPAADERDERDQPEEELRREHLPERDERAHGGGGVAEQARARRGAVSERSPQRHERRDLNEREDSADASVAGDVLRAVRGDHARMAEDGEERGAETLDLQRS